VEIAVDDDGPGIPEDRYEEAFKPFSGWMKAGTRTRRASAWAWPSRATWRAGWAATWCCRGR
jgi:hypothetical protein